MKSSPHVPLFFARLKSQIGYLNVVQACVVADEKSSYFISSDIGIGPYPYDSVGRTSKLHGRLDVFSPRRDDPMQLSAHMKMRKLKLRNFDAELFQEYCIILLFRKMIGTRDTNHRNIVYYADRLFSVDECVFLGEMINDAFVSHMSVSDLEFVKSGLSNPIYIRILMEWQSTLTRMGNDDLAKRAERLISLVHKMSVKMTIPLDPPRQ